MARRKVRKMAGGLYQPAPKPRYGANEKVSGAVAQRSGARLAALGGSVKGVDGADGYTGREARLIRAARRRQKDARPTLYSGPPTPRTPGSPTPRSKKRRPKGWFEV